MVHVPGDEIDQGFAPALRNFRYQRVPNTTSEYEDQYITVRAFRQIAALAFALEKAEWGSPDTNELLESIELAGWPGYHLNSGVSVVSWPADQLFLFHSRQTRSATSTG